MQNINETLFLEKLEEIKQEVKETNQPENIKKIISEMEEEYHSVFDEEYHNPWAREKFFSYTKRHIELKAENKATAMFYMQKCGKGKPPKGTRKKLRQEDGALVEISNLYRNLLENDDAYQSICRKEINQSTDILFRTYLEKHNNKVRYQKFHLRDTKKDVQKYLYVTEEEEMKIADLAIVIIEFASENLMQIRKEYPKETDSDAAEYWLGQFSWFNEYCDFVEKTMSRDILFEDWSGQTVQE